MAHVRDKYSYSSDDKKAITTLKSIYIATILENKENNETPFDTEDSKKWLGLRNNTTAKHRPEVDSTDSMSYWEQKLTSGICKDQATYLIGLILEYQETRKKKFFGSGAPDDPTGVFFDEFKQWLITLSAYSLNDIDKCTADIQKRIDYLARIIAKPEIFPPTRRANHFHDSRMKLLLRLKIDLEVVIEYVRFFPSTQSAREHFKILLENSKSIIIEGIQALYLILSNDSKAIKHIKIYTEISKHEAIERKKNYVHMNEERLQSLLNEEFAASAFIKNLASQCRRILEFNSDTLQLKQEVILITKMNRASNTQQVVAHELDKDIHSNIQHAIQFLQKDPKNIDAHFLNKTDDNNQMIFELFVRLHFLLFEFAKEVKIITLGYQLAGIGGDLALYGFLNARTRQGLENYYCILTQITTDFNELKKKLMSREAKEIHNRERSSWAENYSAAIDALKNIDRALQVIERSVREITALLHTIDLKSLLQELYTGMRQFACMIYDHNNYMHKKFPKIKFSALNFFELPPSFTEQVWGSLNVILPNQDLRPAVPQIKSAEDSKDEEKKPELNSPLPPHYLEAQNLWFNIRLASLASWEPLKQYIEKGMLRELKKVLGNGQPFWKKNSDYMAKGLHQLLTDIFTSGMEKQLEIINKTISLVEDDLEAAKRKNIEHKEDPLIEPVRLVRPQHAILQEIKDIPDLTIEEKMVNTDLKNAVQSFFSFEELAAAFNLPEEKNRQVMFETIYNKHSKNFEDIIQDMIESCINRNQAKKDELIDLIKRANGNNKQLQKIKTALENERDICQKAVEEQKQNRFDFQLPDPRKDRYQWETITKAIRALLEYFDTVCSHHADYSDIKNNTKNFISQTIGQSPAEMTNKSVSSIIEQAMMSILSGYALLCLRDKDENTLMHIAFNKYKQAKQGAEEDNYFSIIELLYQNGADAMSMNRADQNAYDFAGFAKMEQEAVRKMNKDETRKIWRLKSLEARYLIAWSPLSEEVKERLIDYIEKRKNIDSKLEWFLVSLKKIIFKNQVKAHDSLVPLSALLKVVKDSIKEMDDTALSRWLENPSDFSKKHKKSALKEMALQLRETNWNNLVPHVCPSRIDRQERERQQHREENQQLKEKNRESESKINAANEKAEAANEKAEAANEKAEAANSKLDQNNKKSLLQTEQRIIGLKNKIDKKNSKLKILKDRPLSKERDADIEEILIEINQLQEELAREQTVESKLKEEQQPLLAAQTKANSIPEANFTPRFFQHSTSPRRLTLDDITEPPLEEQKTASRASAHKSHPTRGNNG